MILYNIGIWLYGGAVKVASLFNPKAKQWVVGRRRIFERLRRSITANDKIVWIHCASLGEFEQGRPVIEQIRRRYPHYKIMLTFFSPSGYEIRKEYEGADFVFYLPLDTPRNAKRFLRIVQPEVAIFIKYEYWLNYLKQLRKSSCRTYIVSSIFRENSVFFRPYGGQFRRALETFRVIFVQDSESKELLQTIGVENVEIAGDTRFDRVAEIAKGAKRLKIVENFIGTAQDKSHDKAAEGAKGKTKIVVAGSTWQPDEELLSQLMEDYPDVKFIVAPHEMDEERITKLVERHNAVRYTECDEGAEISDRQLLVVDTIGLLSSVYKYGDVGYIGGGFGEGIHNTLEAATFGLPIAFGPNYQKFREARELIEVDGALSITNYGELKEWFDALISDNGAYQEAHQNALNYVEQNVGATEMILNQIFGEQ